MTELVAGSTSDGPPVGWDSGATADAGTRGEIRPGQTITLLGAGGFLGSALARSLSRRPINLRLVARRPPLPPADAVATVSIHHVDVTDRHTLSATLLGSDGIVLALRPRGDWRRADTAGLGELINAGVVRTIVETFWNQADRPLCVFLGSAGQAGPHPARALDGTEVDAPDSDYERYKLAAERLMLDADRAGSIRATSLRFDMVYGQQAQGGTDPGMVRALIVQALRGADLTLWGDGSIRRDLMYVEDGVAAITAALAAPEPLLGRHWLVGTGLAQPLSRLFTGVADAVAEYTRRSAVAVVSAPPPACAVTADRHDVMVDPRPFHAMTGWTPTITLEEGVARTVAVLGAQIGTQKRDR